MLLLPRVNTLLFLPLLAALEPREERESERRDFPRPCWLLTDFLDLVDRTDLADGLLFSGVCLRLRTPLVNL